MNEGAGGADVPQALFYKIMYTYDVKYSIIKADISKILRSAQNDKGDMNASY